ncbi:MAG: FAD-dependent oxidoreductase [Acidibacter sp.]|nr:FAD-dependent oxidoreductase [Acidibacter sp.]
MSVAIIGAGQAAAQLIDSLRRRGHAGAITLVGDEGFPYQRPPLSKKYLAGELGLDRLQLRQPSYFDEQRVELRLGRRATAIDRHPKQVQLVGGATLDYEHLIIATGSHPRRLKMPGADLAGVHYLRSLSDADHLRTEVHVGQRAVIIGGGYIGLEVAATLRQLGMEVTVLEMADRVMNRVVAEPVSRYYEREHASHGVKIELDVGVLALQGDTNGRVCAVETNRGAIAANLVVVGIGVLPTDELAQNAGLACDNGIVVDEYCRTSDQAIFAIGDCSNHPSAHYGRRVRLESVDNAFEQANTVATNITGTPTKHDRVPWFWSDQYHHKLLIVGLADGHDQAILRGDQANHSFSVCYLRDGEFIAIDTVNMAKDQMAARKLIASRMRPDPNKLADISIALKDCG